MNTKNAIAPCLHFYPLGVLLVASLGTVCDRSEAASKQPNIIFILCDDLAMGDVGCFGQTKIKTPNIDRMATEGTRFTHLYTGTSVCAPSRCALLTGLHMGHAAVRANREIQPEGQMPLPAGTYTVARLLQGAGYATACIGKWGLGMFDTTGSPLKLGFDHFFGYNCQRHAHDYFPKYLYRDAERFELDGKTYAQNLIANDTLEWVTKQKDRPFFLYYAVTLPHGKYEIDDLGAYANLDWPRQEKTYAAMVTRLDSDVGRLLARLKELKLDEKTIVLLSAGDNGSAFNPDSQLGRFFNQSLGMRGNKRTMYEGGLRQGGVVRWPGSVPSGRVSDYPWAFWDFLPTAAELAGAKVPDGVQVDGLSIVSALTGGVGPQRESFYWELHEPNFMQASRSGDWKVVRPTLSSPIELYNLATDPGERNDLAAQRPDVLKKLTTLMAGARVDSPAWPPKDKGQKAKKAKTKGKAQ
jgi:arylsulfatase A-like enzyme